MRLDREFIQIPRRRVLAGAIAAAAGLVQTRESGALLLGKERGSPSVPVRAITRGPKHHWFGYYDKLQFDPSGRYALGMEVDFEHREPKPDDVIRIGMVDLESGRQEQIVSLADVAKVPLPEGELAKKADTAKAKHWFNHLLVNPDGTRLEFLHRWRPPGQQGFWTRMCTCGPDGSELRIVDHSGYTSYFIWRDPRHILAWTRQEPGGDGFYLFEDKRGGEVAIVGKGVMTENGHCNYLPGGQWILNDTYPDRGRRQHVYLYHVPTGRRVSLGQFISPPQYQGSWRCDTHPRYSPDGRTVVIDSPHGGEGRQMYAIDVRPVVG